MFVLITVEQLADLSSYSTREDIKVDTIEECYTKYFTKCANISNSIEKSHNYALVAIIDIFGNDLKHETFGTWVEPQPIPPEPEEND